MMAAFAASSASHESGTFSASASAFAASASASGFCFLSRARRIEASSSRISLLCFEEAKQKAFNPAPSSPPFFTLTLAEIRRSALSMTGDLSRALSASALRPALMAIPTSA